MEALRARAFLYSIAELSGGRVFQPMESRELARIYQSILDELGVAALPAEQRPKPFRTVQLPEEPLIGTE